MSEYRVDGLSRGSGFIIQGIGGEAVPRYSLVYLSGSNTWSRADASAAATLPVVGLAVEPLALGQNGRILLNGVVNNNAWAWTPGDVLYASDTAGALTNVAGTVQFEVGVAITATEIVFNPASFGGGGGGGSGGVEADSQAEVYSTDGGTTFDWQYIDGNTVTSGATGLADPAAAIEAAWSYLNGLGGGVLRTRGPGETWELASTINSQGDNVEWISDWGLLISPEDGLNSTMFSLDHDFVKVKGVCFDGNKDNQGSGNCLVIGDNREGIVIDGCKFVDIWGHGIYIEGQSGTESHDMWVVNNYFDSCGTNGATQYRNINSYYTYNIHIKDNTLLNPSHQCIFIRSSKENFVTGNYCYNFPREDSPAIELYIGNECVIDGNICDTGLGEGISITLNCHNNIVNGNYIYNIGADPTAQQAIIVTGLGSIKCTYNIVTNNIINTTWGPPTGGPFGHGIYVYHSDSTLIEGNMIYNVDGSGICIQGAGAGDAMHNVIVGNYVEGSYARYAIEMGTLQEQNDVSRGNYLESGGFGVFSEQNGPNIYAEYHMTPIDGTAFLSTDSAAMGWEIDDTGEYCVFLGVVPENVQDILRFELIGVTLAAPGVGNGMCVTLLGEGGKRDEAFSNEAISVTSKVCNETAPAANDVVSWNFTASDDTDIGHLTSFDKLQFKVKYSAAVDTDIATDAVFGTLIMKYV